MIDLGKLPEALKQLHSTLRRCQEENYEEKYPIVPPYLSLLMVTQHFFETIGYKPEARGDEGLNIPGKIKWMSKEELMKMFPDKPKRA